MHAIALALWIASFLLILSHAKKQDAPIQAPGLSLLEKDCLCICRHFNKRNGSALGSEGADEFCTSIGFEHRWEPMFPGRVELGVGIGGLRSLVFRSKTGDQSTVIFGFRDFLHEKFDYFIDDDFFQEISMYGNELLPRKYGVQSTVLANILTSVVFSVRYWLGFDYHKHASAFVEEVLSRGKKARRPVFTGYGFGGAMAQLQTQRLETSMGITFAAHGVKRQATVYGYRGISKRHVNLILDSDEEKLMGEQSSKQCMFPAPELFTLLGETSSVFSNQGLIQVEDVVRSCTDPQDIVAGL